MMSKSVGNAMIGLPTMPGKKGVVELEVTREHPMISGGWMLSMTNDGFAAVNAVNALSSRSPALFIF